VSPPHQTTFIQEVSMNSKLKAVLFILVLLIPTYLAVAAYITSQSASVEDSRSVIKMTLSDPDGRIYTFQPEENKNASKEEKDAAAQAKTEIEFLTSLNRNAKALDDMPDTAGDARVFTVTYDSFNRTSVYKYYFTNDPASAFFEDPENKVYQIASADAAAFLCKDYAACLYEGSVYPVLTIGSSTVTPKELDWRYQLFNGSYRPLDTVTTDEMHNYRMNARLNFSFNLHPDVIDITIYDGEDIIYKDNYANLSQISITEQKQLHFQISAKWYEVDGKEGQGEALYDFMATVNAPASFYLNQETITNGDFCVITVKDKPEDSEITSLLDERLFTTPAFALAQASKVTAAMAGTARSAFKLSLEVLGEYDEKKIEKITELENKADKYEDALGTYLVKLSSYDMVTEDSAQVTKLLHVIGDLERISDHAVNIAEAAEEMHDKKLLFSAEATKEIGVIRSALDEIIDLTYRAVVDGDADAADAVEPLEDVIDDLRDEIKLHHVLRLQKSECTIEHGFVLSDILTDLERVSDHCSNLATCSIEIAAKGDLNLHKYTNNIKQNSEKFKQKVAEYKEKYAL